MNGASLTLNLTLKLQLISRLLLRHQNGTDANFIGRTLQNVPALYFGLFG
jgi:hypothetical protein